MYGQHCEHEPVFWYVCLIVSALSFAYIFQISVSILLFTCISLHCAEYFVTVQQPCYWPVNKNI